MNRTDRLMAIVSLLQSKKQMNAAQIATHFGISERTIYRDLRAMDEIGVPIAFEPEKGYYIVGGYFLPPISLTVEEANAFALVAPIVLRFADRSIHHHFTSALDKIKMVLSPAQRAKLEATQVHTQHYLPKIYEHLLPDTHWLAPIQTAILNKNILRLEYENAEKVPSTRDVEPIGLIFYSLNWHLVAWCHLRQDYRDFRTSRIQNLTVSMMPFRKTDHISLGDYLAEIEQQTSA